MPQFHHFRDELLTRESRDVGNGCVTNEIRNRTAQSEETET